MLHFKHFRMTSSNVCPIDPYNDLQSKPTTTSKVGYIRRRRSRQSRKCGILLSC